MDNRLVRFTKWLLDAMFYGGLVITLGIPVIFRSAAVGKSERNVEFTAFLFFFCFKKFEHL